MNYNITIMTVIRKIYDENVSLFGNKAFVEGQVSYNTCAHVPEWPVRFHLSCYTHTPYAHPLVHQVYVGSFPRAVQCMTCLLSCNSNHPSVSPLTGIEPGITGSSWIKLGLGEK